jgi:hypothetical protein
MGAAVPSSVFAVTGERCRPSLLPSIVLPPLSTSHLRLHLITILLPRRNSIREINALSMLMSRGDHAVTHSPRLVSRFHWPYRFPISVLTTPAARASALLGS